MRYKTKETPSIIQPSAIFFVGIKGVGMTPLSIIAKEAGIEVAGSDLSEQYITDSSLEKNSIGITSGFDVQAIKKFLDGKAKTLVITTGAHKGFDNPQVAWAQKNGIPVLTQGQALGKFMEGQIFGREFEGISVAGSHGKTTISALLATSLKACGLEPSYAIGTGELFPLGFPGQLGSGSLFVAEADEYASEPVYDRVPKFLYQTPKYAIFNNIDFDHPDLFENIEEIEDAFLEFSHNVKSGGKIFANGDDPRLLNLVKNIHKDVRVITYGTSVDLDYSIGKIVQYATSTRFTVKKKGEELGVFEIHIPGAHNAKNALSVISFLFELGYKTPEIKEAVGAFLGSKRRSEIIGITKNGAFIIDDYAHHPREIQTTLSALKRSYPDKKIICLFQPHTYSRTRVLLGDFADSFSSVDKLLMLPIFRSSRDTEKDNIDLQEFRKAFEKTDVYFAENEEHMLEYVNQNFDSSDNLIITLGAGDVYKIGYKLKA